MDIIPVLDIINNKVVKAIKGDRSKYASIDSKLYNSIEPIEIINQLSKRYSPHIIYIADLDAISNKAVNHELFNEILRIFPKIVLVVDELADLMMVVGKKVEHLIARLAQKARAAGIHMLLATQRPSVDVITGLIKANISARMAFNVASSMDSRVVLDQVGAEQLLGKGDMLFMSSANRIIRIHGPYVSEKEIEKISSVLRAQGEPDYIEDITTTSNNTEDDNGISNGETDDLYNEALNIIKSEGKASTSFLQRKLQIGYNRAARIIDMMEEKGIVSKANHVGKREVL